MVIVMGIYMVPQSVLRCFCRCSSRWISGIESLQALTAKAQKLLLLLIAGLRLQSLSHFAWPSVRVSQTMAFLPQSHDCSCYVSRPVPTPPPLRLQKHTDLLAHDFAHSSHLWQQHRLANVACAFSLRLCGINSAVYCLTYFIFYISYWGRIVHSV